MAEYIERTDTLNEGREKLNKSIKDADKAKEDAIQALARSLSAEQIAQLAKLATEETQQQLDNVIIESGTSDAETIQARGKYDLLYQRLNASDEELADKAELKVFQRIPSELDLADNELGLVLIPLFPFNYDFNGTSGLPWDNLKFDSKKYEATTGLINKEKSYSELKDNHGLIRVSKSATSGLATVENKTLLDLDFTNNKKYRIRFDVLRSIVNGVNRGNCGISISPLSNPPTYYPFDYTLTDGISFNFGYSSAHGSKVTVNFRKIVSANMLINSNIAGAGGFTNSAAGFLALDEGEFHHIDLTISTNELKLAINDTEYLNIQEDLGVLNSPSNKLVFWGMVNDADSIEVNHFFDNVLIDEVV